MALSSDEVAVEGGCDSTVGREETGRTSTAQSVPVRQRGDDTCVWQPNPAEKVRLRSTQRQVPVIRRVQSQYHDQLVRAP